MAMEISSIQLPVGYTYKFKDEVARQAIEDITGDIETAIGIVSGTDDGLMSSTMYNNAIAPLNTAITDNDIAVIFGDLVEEQGYQTATDP